MVLSKALATAQRVCVRNMGTFRHYEGKMKETDLRAFTWSGIKKNIAIWPLVFIISGAIVGMTGFIVYHGRTRIDVAFNRNNPPISESMDMMNPSYLKLRSVHQELVPNPELAAGLEVTRSYK